MEANGYTLESGANLSAVKMKKVVRSLVVAIVFLAGCSSSGSSSSTTTDTGVTTTVAQVGIVVNGYRIYPGANLVRANLFDADLADADLSGADLSYANLEGADRQEGLCLDYWLQHKLGKGV